MNVNKKVHISGEQQIRLKKSFQFKNLTMVVRADIYIFPYNSQIG